jgi:phenylacetate-CoA ligase
MTIATQSLDRRIQFIPLDCPIKSGNDDRRIRIFNVRVSKCLHEAKKMKNFRNFLWKQILSFRGNTLRNLNQVERWQWLDQKQMHALQQERLGRLLLHSYNHVPFYRHVLGNAGVVDDDGKVNVRNFSQIPLLDKSAIRVHYEKLKSDDLATRKWHENTSGGSTGEPVRFVQDKDNHEWLTAVKMLDDLWSGYSVTEKKIILWGSVRDLLIGRETLKTRLGQWLRNEIWLNAFHMTPERMHAYVECINGFQPVQILSYVESIYELSRFIEREGLQINNPRSIMTSAGALDRDMRKTIEWIFKAPVFNRYGSREVGDIACECDHHKGLHISLFTHFVEILKQDGTPAEVGEIGEIVVTLLTNYAMPLIRYRIGDMGAWAEQTCTCGRAWPLLKEVSGRITDNFITKGGTLVYGAFFRHLLFFRDWIVRYQIIQEDYDLIRILIVPHEPNGMPVEFHDREVKDITEKIRLVMGQSCHVDFDFVDDIVPLPSGKYRYTISKVRDQ